jgi:hypothetical protein
MGGMNLSEICSRDIERLEAIRDQLMVQPEAADAGDTDAFALHEQESARVRELLGRVDKSNPGVAYSRRDEIKRLRARVAWAREQLDAGELEKVIKSYKGSTYQYDFDFVASYLEEYESGRRVDDLFAAALRAKPGKITPTLSDSYYGSYIQKRSVDGQVFVLEEAPDGQVYLTGGDINRKTAPFEMSQATQYGLTGQYDGQRWTAIHGDMAKKVQDLAKVEDSPESQALKTILNGCIKEAGGHLSSRQFGQVMAVYDRPVFKECFDLLTRIKLGEMRDRQEYLRKYISGLKVAYKACEVAADVGVEAAGLLGQIQGGKFGAAVAKGAMTALVSWAKGNSTADIITDTVSVVIGCALSGLKPGAIKAASEGVRVLLTELFKSMDEGEEIDNDKVQAAIARGILAGLASYLIGGSDVPQQQFINAYKGFAVNKCVEEIFNLASGDEIGVP